MNLGRIGHYHVPVGGTDNEGRPHGGCRTALVVHVLNEGNLGLVSLAVWNANGGQETREAVPVGAANEETATFHLSLECPWGR